MKISTSIKIFIGIFLFFAVERFCCYQTGGFRVSKVCVEHDYAFTEASTEIPSEIRDLLHQNFTFLGRGVQFFAFLGNDQKTVLKLFKHHHTGLSIDLIEKWFPKCFQASLIQKRERRMLRLLKSAHIAYKHLPNETGVIFCHLGKKPNDSIPIILRDKLGTKYFLDLAKTEFVLQKKAISVETTLHTLLKQNRIEETIQAINKLLLLIEQRSQKGIKNKDGKVLQNYGFIDEQPIEVDIGSYIYRNHSTCANPHHKAALKAKKQLLEWIQKHYVKCYDHIKKATAI